MIKVGIRTLVQHRRVFFIEGAAEHLSSQRRGIVRQILRNLRGGETVQELIGGARRTVLQFRSRFGFYTRRDWGQADYAFWDRARRGRAYGLELSGLFLKPLASKVAAWVLGQQPTWKGANEKAVETLNAWWDRNHPKIIHAFEEAVALGDSYIVINPDLSLTVLPPHVVDPVVDPRDYSKIIGWRATVTHMNPTQAADEMTITDEYYGDRRIRTFTTRTGTRTETYRNRTGIPMLVHVPNLFGADEVYGKPEGYALVHLMHRYGEVIEAAISGNIRQGRPTPVIEKMGDAESVSKFWELFGRRETTTLPDGSTETVDVVDFDPDQLLTLGADATFKYASPSSFTQDTSTLLGLMFYLMLQHTEVPEFVWGNAIASSQASAETQLPPFVKWLEKKRGLAEDWLLQIADIVVRLNGLWEVGIDADADISMQWRSITDANGQLTLDTLKWAYNEAGLLDRKTALSLLPVDITDPDAVLARRDKEDEEAKAENDAQINADIRRLGDERNSIDDEDGDEQPEPARQGAAA